MKLERIECWALFKKVFTVRFKITILGHKASYIFVLQPDSKLAANWFLEVKSESFTLI